MDTFFTRLFTVILSYLHSHHPNPKKKKERKKKQIKFETLIKRFLLANRGGNVRDTRRKFIFPQQLLLFVCKKKRKKERKSRLSPDLSAINYGRYGMNGRWIRKKKKGKKTEEEEEQSEER